MELFFRARLKGSGGEKSSLLEKEISSSPPPSSSRATPSVPPLQPLVLSSTSLITLKEVIQTIVLILPFVILYSSSIFTDLNVGS